MTNKPLLVFLACLQCSLLAGVVFGWASVAGSLLLASEQDGGADLSSEQTTRIFAAAASVSSFSPLLLGLVLDKYGPRACNLLAHCVIAAGCWLFAVSDTFAQFNAATCLIAFGGPGIITSVVHIANLFEKTQFLVMSSVTGSMTLSFLVLPVFGVLWRSFEPVSIRNLFGCYTVVVGFSAIASLLTWPDKPFQKGHVFSEEEEEESESDQESLVKKNASAKTPPAPFPDVSYEDEVVEATIEHHKLYEQPLNSFLRSNSRRQLDRKMSFIQSRQAVEQGKTNLVHLKDQPFSKQVTSLVYWRCLVVFICTVFFANLYIGALSIELADMRLFPTKQQHQLANTFTLIMSCGTPVSFASGWLMDLVGLEACTACMLFFGVVHMLVILLFGEDSKHIMVLGFVCYTLFRNSTFPIFIASVSHNLGFKYFGLLSGIGYALAGVTQLFMVDLIHLVQGDCHLLSSSGGISDQKEEECDSGAWIDLHVVQLTCFCVLGLVPLWDYRARITRQRLEEEYRALTPVTVSTRSLSSPYGSLDSIAISPVVLNREDSFLLSGRSLGLDIEVISEENGF